MNSSAPQTPGDKFGRFPGVPALLLFLFAIGVPSAAAVTFAQSITHNPWQWLALGLLYEFCIGILGFMGKVWQKLEGSLDFIPINESGQSTMGKLPLSLVPTFCTSCSTIRLQ